MPYSLDWEPSGVQLKFSGDVTFRSRRDALNEVCSDPRFDNLLFVIVDYLEVETYEVSAGAVEEIAALQIGAFRTNPRVVIASVATHPHVVAAIEKLIGLGFIEAQQVIVPSLEQARDWISKRRGRPSG